MSSDGETLSLDGESLSSDEETLSSDGEALPLGWELSGLLETVSLIW